MLKSKVIAYLGPENTFTHEAARKYSPDSKLVACSTIDDVFKAVGLGEDRHPDGCHERYVERVDAGIVAYRNIKGGDVVDTLDLLLNWYKSLELQKKPTINIVDSITLDINMSIGGLCRKEEVKAIISHRKALQQCRNYLAKNFPNASQIETDSTAKGIELILSEDPLYKNAAALANPLAFKDKNIPVYEENVADIKHNKTIFLIIKRGIKAPLSKKSKIDMTTIAVEPKHPIYNFSTHLFDLFKKYKVTYKDHHLRPTGKDIDIHYFDLEGHINGDNNLQKCLNALETEMPFKDKVGVYSLGSYHYEQFFPSIIQRIAIIGASEGKGKTFRDFFKKAGYDVELAKEYSPIVIELPEESPKRQLNSKYMAEITNCAKYADVILLNTFRKYREAAVRALAPHIYTGKLLVVNSNKLKGEEERIMKWIREETEKQIPPLVKEYRSGRTDANTGTERFVKSAVKKHTGSDEEITKVLVKEHCNGIEFLGMDALITGSFPTIKGQGVVFIKEPDKLEEMTKTKEFIDIFYKHGADVILTDIKTHDTYTGMAKNISNLCALTVAETISSLGPAFPLKYEFSQLMRYSTPDVKLFYSLLIKFLSGSPEAEVTNMFKFEKKEELLKRFEMAAHIIQIVCEHDDGAYNKTFIENAKRTKNEKPAAIELVKKCFKALTGNK